MEFTSNTGVFTHHLNGYLQGLGAVGDTGDITHQQHARLMMETQTRLLAALVDSVRDLQTELAYLRLCKEPPKIIFPTSSTGPGWNPWGEPGR